MLDEHVTIRDRAFKNKLGCFRLINKNEKDSSLTSFLDKIKQDVSTIAVIYLNTYKNMFLQSLVKIEFSKRLAPQTEEVKIESEDEAETDCNLEDVRESETIVEEDRKT